VARHTQREKLLKFSQENQIGASIHYPYRSTYSQLTLTWDMNTAISQKQKKPLIPSFLFRYFQS
jgi:hypothetical protein